ncbi:cell division cycle protein 23 homolog isoform X3 [Sipha flava]|nr:cell division cycle protein 23 homolog isoform X3 [Sipha flava]
MFLHYMARYLSMHNESIYERVNIFDSYKPLNMRKFMELLDELLILNVYGTEDDSDEESEGEPPIQEMLELETNNQNNYIQLEDDSTPKGRRCSRRPRNQRIERPSTTAGKKNVKNTKRNNATKKAKISSSASQSEPNTSTTEFRIKREDPYLLWLTAVMLKRIDRCDEAVELLIRAIRLQPCHWGAWIELSTLIKDVKMLDELNSRLLENNEHHWMHLLFIAHVLIDFQIIERGVDIYHDILNKGHIAFKSWPYLYSQLATAHHNKRGKNEIKKSVVSFTNIIKLDPYRIDNFDLLSNLMYVFDNREELIALSKHVASIDRYRQETLCVLGNMYSLKCDHAKSVLYFKKAVRMNPFNVTAWTLLGHEYIEMKNSFAAIISYRQALKINIRDYRAWYGLGQIYELVKLPNYALFYFTHARELRPRDFRMLLALGEMFERTDRIYEALTCYYKALHYDTDGGVLLKLWKYYEKYGDSSIQTTRDHFNVLNKKALKTAFKNKSDMELNLILSKIYLYLGHHYMDLHYYDRAISLAEKCRNLCIEMQDSTCQCLIVLEHVSALINEVEARAGSDGCPGSTPGAIKARRFLFAL